MLFSDMIITKHYKWPILINYRCNFLVMYFILRVMKLILLLVWFFYEWVLLYINVFKNFKVRLIYWYLPVQLISQFPCYVQSLYLLTTCTNTAFFCPHSLYLLATYANPAPFCPQGLAGNNFINNLLESSLQVSSADVLNGMYKLDSLDSNQVLNISAFFRLLANYTQCITTDRFMAQSTEQDMERLALQLYQNNTYLAGKSGQYLPSR